MTTLAEQIDAWTPFAAEPAVRAAERAIVTESSAILADTLAISAESRRRLARVLALKDEAASDPGRREAYHRAADDLRSWAAGVYLAVQRAPHAPAPEQAGEAPRAALREQLGPHHSS